MHDRIAGAEAAIMRSAAVPIVMLASFNTGLPDELLASPSEPPSSTPHEVAADLAAAAREPEPPSREMRALLAPLEPSDLAALPANPDARRPRLGARRRVSEPDRLHISRTPPPLSFLPAEPLDLMPGPGSEGPEREVQRPATAEFILPIERGRVTSLFNQGRYHPAIDLAGPLGSRVHATTRKQRVIFTGWRNGYGNTVVTRDDAGRMHLYAHLQRIATKVGTILDQGLMLGTLGSTGRSTGPHVHYEVKTRAGAHLNPAGLLFAGRRVGRGFAWNGSRSVTRVAARSGGQPRPR